MKIATLRLQDKIIYFSLLALFFLEPLYIDPGLHSQEIGKALILRLLTLSALIGWFIKIYKAKRIGLSGSLLDFLVISLLIVTIISVIFSIDPKLSLLGNYNRYEGLLTFSNYIILYFLSSALFFDRNKIIILFKVILFSFIFSGSYGVLQYFGYDIFQWEGAISYRVHSTFGNPVFFGAYLCMILPISLYIYLFYKPRIFWGSLAFFVYLLLLFTQTRGAILAAFLALVLFFFLLRRYLLTPPGLTLTLKLAIPVIILTIIINLHPSTSFIKRFTKEIIKKEEPQQLTLVSSPKEKESVKFVGGAGGRIEIYKTVLSIIKDYPLLGTGPESLEVLFPYYKTLEYVRTSSDYNRSNRAHNQILEFFMTRGILGGCIYLFILFILFYRGIKMAKGGDNLAAALVCCILAYTLQNLTGFDTISISCLFWVLAGILNNLSTSSAKKGRTFKKTSLFALVIIGLGGLWLYQSVKDFFTNRIFQLAERYRYSGYEEESINLYKKVLKIIPYETRYYDPLIDIYLKKDPKEAIKLIEHALRFIKDNYVYYFYLGLCYDRLGNTELAEKMYKKAIANCRYFGDAFCNLGEVYKRQGKLEEAKFYLNRAYNINPKKGEYIESLANFYLGLGKDKEALTLYRTLVQVAPDYHNIIKIRKQLRGLYYKYGKIEETIKECEEILKFTPNDIETLWGLATLYYNSGKLEKAKKICHKILTINPTHNDALRMLLFIKRRIRQSSS